MPTITANVFNVTGKLANMTLFTNNIGADGYSNISVSDNLHVGGSVFIDKRMDVGSTIFATFRLTSNVPFTNNELQLTSNEMLFDWMSSDMSSMNGIDMSIPRSNIYNQTTGEITVPVSGLYNLEMQGVFSNNGNVPNLQNGVYYYFKNHPHPTTRVAAKMTSGNIISTSHSAFLLAGDRFVPTFYTNDQSSTLVATNNETYVSFLLTATVTPTHSNYVRI